MAQRMEEPLHSPHCGATRTAGDFLHSSVDRNVGAASKVVKLVPAGQPASRWRHEVGRDVR